MSHVPRILLPSQKKRVLEICQKHGIPGHEFVWDETRVGSPSAPLVSRLDHKSTGYYFLFDFYPNGNHENIYSPAEHGLRFEQNHSSWETTFENVENWAKYLAREVDAKSFLDRVQEIPALEHIAELNIDDTAFNADEIQQIDTKLDLIQARLLECLDTLDDHRQYVEEQFEKLKQHSRSMGRVSWLQLFIGALVSLMSAFIEPDAAQTIWQFANDQITSIISKLPRLRN